MIPKEEIYIPPMNINVLDHRHFGRKPIVGVHVIKSLSKFRVDRNKEAFLFSNIEGKFPLLPTTQAVLISSHKTRILFSF